MAEVEGAGGVRVALDELRQAIPGLGVERRVGIALEHARHELAREARAEDGGPPQQRSVRRGEVVDPAGDHALDAFGQRLESMLGDASGCDELLNEERVAAGALGDRGQLVGRQLFLRRGECELVRIGLGQGVEPERHRRHRRVALRRDEAAARGAAGRADEPGLAGDPAAEVPK